MLAAAADRKSVSFPCSPEMSQAAAAACEDDTISRRRLLQIAVYPLLIGCACVAKQSNAHNGRKQPHVGEREV